MESSQVMNHQEAEEAKATERYLLREMNEAERMAFEDHYLDCPQCLEAVTFAADFLDAGRELAEEQRNPQAEPVPWRQRLMAAFKPTLKPVPIMAFALCASMAFAGYEALLLTKLKSGNPEKVASVEYRYILTGMAHGSGDTKKITVPKGAIVSVGVEYNPGGEFISYQAHVVNQAGSTRYAVDLPSDQMGNVVSIALRTQLFDPGSYTAAVFGLRSDGKEVQIGEGSFELIYK